MEWSVCSLWRPEVGLDTAMVLLELKYAANTQPVTTLTAHTQFNFKSVRMWQPKRANNGPVMCWCATVGMEGSFLTSWCLYFWAQCREKQHLGWVPILSELVYRLRTILTILHREASLNYSQHLAPHLQDKGNSWPQFPQIIIPAMHSPDVILWNHVSEYTHKANLGRSGKAVWQNNHYDVSKDWQWNINRGQMLTETLELVYVTLWTYLNDIRSVLLM
jgi:hypothetical protein